MGGGTRRYPDINDPKRRSIPAWVGEPRTGCPILRNSAVYPRVGGGTRAATPFDVNAAGLSPRGRGNRCYHVLEIFDRGSIPAWAGEPLPGCRYVIH